MSHIVAFTSSLITTIAATVNANATTDDNNASIDVPTSTSTLTEDISNKKNTLNNNNNNNNNNDIQQAKLDDIDPKNANTITNHPTSISYNNSNNPPTAAPELPIISTTIYSNSDDPESTISASFTLRSDPLLLRKAVKPSVELARLKRSGKNGKKLSAFYEKQNELIESFLTPVEDKTEDEADAEEARLLKLKIAIWGSLVANLFLFFLQLAAAILSGSLALFATMADAFMDLSSSAVLVYTGYAANSTNETKYPTGKAKFETAGIIVFSSLMSTVSIELIVESCKALASKSYEVDLNFLAIGCVGIAIAIKFLLFLYCSALSSYPSAKILAQDHRNDLGVNSIGILTTVLGSRLAAWIDPVGAMLIALIILRSWAITAYEHIQLIVGTTASPAFLQRLTYLAMTHDPRVLQIDTCRAYNAGSNYWVEVDIVLSPEMPLNEAHDIGEALQIKLERLPNVERAFVHLDFETSHTPEHRKVK